MTENADRKGPTPAICAETAPTPKFGMACSDKLGAELPLACGPAAPGTIGSLVALMDIGSIAWNPCGVGQAHACKI